MSDAKLAMHDLFQLAASYGRSSNGNFTKAQTRGRKTRNSVANVAHRNGVKRAHPAQHPGNEWYVLTIPMRKKDGTIMYRNGKMICKRNVTRNTYYKGCLTVMPTSSSAIAKLPIL